MSVGVTATCVSLMLSLAGLSIPDVHVPDVTRTADLNITALRCADLTLGGAVVEYNSHTTAVALRNATDLQCSADIAFRLTAGAAASSGRLELGVRLPAHGRFNVTTATRPGSCLAANVTASTCTLEPELTQLALADPKGPDAGLVALVLSLAKSTLATDLRGAVCGKALAGLEHQLTNHTLDPLTPYPPLRPGASDLRTNDLFRGLATVVQSLPVLFGLRLGWTFPAPTVFRIDAVADHAATLPLGPAGSVAVPAGFGLALDVFAPFAVCSNGRMTGCDLRGGFTLRNVRAIHGGEVNRLVDNFLGVALEAVVDDALAQLGMNRSTVPLMMQTPATHPDPPVRVLAGIVAALTATGVAIVYFCTFRPLRGKVLYAADGRIVSFRTKLLCDAVIVGGSLAAIVLFAWSNMTSAAQVKLGDAVPLYSFSLTNTVKDLWKAGLKPLSFFVALFSGFYPYFKMSLLVFFGVVLQRPQNTLLLAIDAVGKFSLLDSFVMTILANGLAIKGIADVTTLPSFYVFLGATLLSILVGNFTTHCPFANVTESPPMEGSDEQSEAERSVGVPVAEDTDDERLLCHKDEEKDPHPAHRPAWGGHALQSLQDDPGLLYSIFVGDASRAVEKPRWRPLWGLALAAPITGASAASLLLPTIRYHKLGLATIITGTVSNFSLWDLFSASVWPLLAVCSITVFAAPTLMAVGFQRARIATAWCATDAFILACLAGLMQLEQFVQFVLGSAMTPVFSTHAELLWPVYALCGSVVLQWFLIVRYIIHV